MRFGATFGGAGVIRGDLTPECTAAITAVFAALGNKRGAEDHRTQDQRYQMPRSLQEYLRAKLIELAGQPDAEALVARIRARKAAHPVSLTAKQILAYRDEDRR